jgi:hypothetical protein
LGKDCFRLTELCLRLLALGQENLDLLLRAGKSGLGGGNARLGLLRVGSSGLEALARRQVSRASSA